MSVLDKRVMQFNLLHSDTQKMIGHAYHHLHEGQDWMCFAIAGMKDGFALPAREATELAIAILAIAQGLNARGLPRLSGVNPEREELKRLVKALEESPFENTDEQAQALAAAKATLDELADEEGEDGSEEEDERPDHLPIGRCSRCGVDVYIDGGFCGGCTP